ILRPACARSQCERSRSFRNVSPSMLDHALTAGALCELAHLHHHDHRDQRDDHRIDELGPDALAPRQPSVDQVGDRGVPRQRCDDAERGAEERDHRREVAGSIAHSKQLLRTRSTDCGARWHTACGKPCTASANGGCAIPAQPRKCVLTRAVTTHSDADSGVPARTNRPKGPLDPATLSGPVSLGLSHAMYGLVFSFVASYGSMVRNGG